jgi:hypothetical protein
MIMPYNFEDEQSDEQHSLNALFSKVSRVLDGEDNKDVARVAGAIAATAILHAGNSWEEREVVLRQIVEFMRSIVSGENLKIISHRIQ